MLFSKFMNLIRWISCQNRSTCKNSTANHH